MDARNFLDCIALVKLEEFKSLVGLFRGLQCFCTQKQFDEATCIQAIEASGGQTLFVVPGIGYGGLFDEEALTDSMKRKYQYSKKVPLDVARIREDPKVVDEWGALCEKFGA